MPKKSKMGVAAYMKAIFKVGVQSYKIAPSAAIARLADSVIQAGLPIATTFFAAKTTTALTGAYAGEPGAQQSALAYVIITAVLGIASALWGTVSNYINQKTSYLVDAHIEDQMMMQFSRLPFALYDDKDTVDKYEKARRFSRYFVYIFETIGNMLRSILSGIGSIVALVFVNPWLALAILAAVIPGIVIHLQLAKMQMNHWEGNITTRRRRYNISYTLQDPKLIAEMRVYGVVRHLVDIHAKLRDKDEKERMQFELNSSWKLLIASIGESLVELGALVWITLQIAAGLQPVGQFLFVQQLVARALGDMGGLARQIGRMDEDLANMVDYHEFMDLATQQEADKKQKSNPELIHINNVSFAYPKTDKVVLSNINIKIRQGERVAIVGENGAGKSTFTKILMGLYAPTSGSVLLDGIDLSKIDKGSWHDQISLLGQDFAIYDFATMRENITLGNVRRQSNDKDIQKAVERAEFGGVVKSLKHGLNTFTERWMARDNDEASATELSGGQRQRLALARNFYRDSPIIILDEPTSAIDALAEARIFKRLFEQKNKTMVIISHRVTAIEKADQVYMLENGKVVESGTHQELVAKRGKYFTMFESQLH